MAARASSMDAPTALSSASVNCPAGLSFGRTTGDCGWTVAAASSTRSSRDTVVSQPLPMREGNTGLQLAERCLAGDGDDDALEIRSRRDLVGDGMVELHPQNRPARLVGLEVDRLDGGTARCRAHATPRAAAGPAPQPAPGSMGRMETRSSSPVPIGKWLT